MIYLWNYFFSSPTSSTSRFHDSLHNNHFLSVQRLRKDERDLDVDEENWFNDDVDENKITSLNHGTLFNNSSDDDDSQPEITSAISTSEPPRSHHSLLDNDDDGLPTSSRSHYNKPMISIHIGRSSTTALPVDTSSPISSSQSIESSSPYAMVKNKKKKQIFINNINFSLFRVQLYRVLLINIMMMKMKMKMKKITVNHIQLQPNVNLMIMIMNMNKIKYLKGIVINHNND